MSIEAKSILSILLLITGFIAAYSMFYLMGKSDRSMNPAVIRIIHRVAGFVFFVLAIAISYFCIVLLAGYRGELSPIAALHMFSALALLIVLIINISIAHFYSWFLKLSPALGITILVLAFLTVGTSAGYYGIKKLKSRNNEIDSTHVAPADTAASDSSYAGDPNRGETLFASSCSACHSVKTKEDGWGPSLMDLFKMKGLPESGKPVTEENIINQVVDPSGSMPSFDKMSKEELSDLISYLKTL